MATRCNIVLIDANNKRLTLYRHWDGYLAETGADVLKIAAGMVGYNGKPCVRDVYGMANRFLQKHRGDGDDEKGHDADLHGDIEHVYYVHVDSKTIERGYAERKSCDKDVDEWARSPIYHSGLVAFANLVNNDRRIVNRRIKAMKAKYPEQYKDAGLYPMIMQVANGTVTEAPDVPAEAVPQ